MSDRQLRDIYRKEFDEKFSGRFTAIMDRRRANPPDFNRVRLEAMYDWVETDLSNRVTGRILDDIKDLEEELRKTEFHLMDPVMAGKQYELLKHKDEVQRAITNARSEYKSVTARFIAFGRGRASGKLDTQHFHAVLFGFLLGIAEIATELSNWLELGAVPKVEIRE